MDVGRSDVRRRNLRKHIMRKFDARRPEPGFIERELPGVAFGASVRDLSQERDRWQLRAGMSAIVGLRVSRKSCGVAAIQSRKQARVALFLGIAPEIKFAADSLLEGAGFETESGR